MSDLVRMVNGESVAIVRPDWVEEWRGYGYVTEADAVKAQEAAEADAIDAARRAAEAPALAEVEAEKTAEAPKAKKP